VYTPEEYIYAIKNTALKELALFLHNFMLSYNGITSKLSYKIPFYYRNSWICYLNITKENKLEFVFCRGVEMKNEAGLLQFRGRKQVSGLLLESIDDLPLDILDELMSDAFNVDDKKLLKK
jgi:hypothetical protein